MSWTVKKGSQASSRLGYGCEVGATDQLGAENHSFPFGPIKSGERSCGCTDGKFWSNRQVDFM